MSFQQSYEVFAKRIKPSELVQSVHNGKLLNEWVTSQGYSVADLAANDPNKLADVLFRACSDDTLIMKLMWVRPPAKWLLLKNASKTQKQTTAIASEKEFGERTKESDKKDAYEKTQRDARRQITELVDSVLIVGRDGRVSHGQTQSIKDACQAHVIKAIANERDLVQVAKEVAKFIRDEYEKIERANERSL